LELLEAPELLGHVVQARLLFARRLTGGELEQRQVVMLLPRAQEGGTPLRLLVGHLQPQHAGVELFGLLHVAALQTHGTELASLDHASAPRAVAAPRRFRRMPYTLSPDVSIDA